MTYEQGHRRGGLRPRGAKKMTPTTFEEMGDPLRPPLPRYSPQQRVVPQNVLREKDDQDDPRKGDPAATLADYVENYWVQQLQAIRLRCWRCKKDSPVIFVRVGSLLFGARPKPWQIDTTKSTIEECAKVGWKLQLRAAYCPECKNLGSV